MTDLKESSDLGQPWHCFGDELAGMVPQPRTVTDRAQCTTDILAYSRDRFAALNDAHPDHEPHIMLSGGVDSIFLAALCAEHDIPATCWTVSIAPGGTDELTAAQHTADLLGLRHETIELTESDVQRLAREAISALRVSELWEISAAIPLSAGVSQIASASKTPPPDFYWGWR